ncbi:MAG: hypothetical protein QXE31_01090 [Candidatus Woesearchaeota archaeon]
MRYDDYIYGVAGNSPKWNYDNAYISKDVKSYKDGTIGSPFIIIPLGYLFTKINIIYPINIIIARILIHILLLFSLFYFYKSIFSDTNKSLFAIILTYFLPSFSYYPLKILNYYGLISDKNVLKSIYVFTFLQPSVYGGLAISFGLFALGSLFNHKKILIKDSLLLMFGVFSHPVVGSIYLVIYLFFVIYFKIKNIYLLLPILIGFFPWLFIMKDIAKEYLGFQVNTFTVQQTLYAIGIFFLQFGLYFLLVLYIWYFENIKIPPWQWLFFLIIFILTLIPETKFSLIRSSYLKVPLLVSLSIILANWFFSNNKKIFSQNIKKYSLIIILIFGTLSLLTSFYYLSISTLSLKNQEINLLKKLKTMPDGVVIASSELSLFIPSLSNKMVLLGECCGNEKKENIIFYQSLLEGKANKEFQYVTNISYLVAPCNSTPNLNFKLIEKEDFICLWSKK